MPYEKSKAIRPAFLYPRRNMRILYERNMKMAIFTNQATLIYNGQSTSSNVTTGEILTGLTLTKTAINDVYGRDGFVNYVVTVSNAGAAVTGATMTDDLGGYTVGTATVYPLTYVDGSLLFYRNGVLATGPVAIGGPPLVITGIDIPAGGSVQLIYSAVTNEYTPGAAGSTVVNTATVTGAGILEPPSDTATVTARDDVSLTIAKAVCPPVVNDDGTLTYTFIIQNTGNTAVIATDDLVVRDTFNPILNPITVTFDGDVWTEGVEYNYDDTTGEFATVAGYITVPAATYTQDPTTGVFSMTPGVAILTVTGTV